MDDSEPIRELLGRFPKVRLAIVFGSLAREAGKASSDLDLAVLAEAPLDADERAGMLAALGEAVGRPVDLVDLATVGEPLLGEILRDGKRILERDPEAYAELIRRHLFDAADFLPYRRRILEERRRAWLER